MKELSTFTEREWQRHVVSLAQLQAWAPYHTHDSRRSQRGFPDLVLVRPPRVIFSELKTNKGRVRPEQKWWRSLLEGCPGVEYYLWRPSEESQVREVLAR